VLRVLLVVFASRGRGRAAMGAGDADTTDKQSMPGVANGCNKNSHNYFPPATWFVRSPWCKYLVWKPASQVSKPNRRPVTAI